MKELEEVEEYLKLTGQSYQDLMGGANAFGDEFIYELVKKCLLENKKIVWKDIPDKIDAMTYRLVKLKK